MTEDKGKTKKLNYNDIRGKQLDEISSNTRPEECYCSEDFDGAGYTYSDEYGACDFCEEEIKEILQKNKDYEQMRRM